MAARGPTRSSQLPKSAADRPRKTIAVLNTQPMVLTFQSSGAALVRPIAFDSGREKTLKAYAWPMQR